MAKKVAGQLKLQVPAGKANPSPPVGPALGQRGINIMEFCKAFNARTQEMEAGQPTPGRHHLLHRQVLPDGDQDAAGVVPAEEGGEAQVGLEGAGQGVAGSVTLAQVREIAEAKMKDLNANDVEAAMLIIAGSARSMGIEVKG